MSDQQTTSEMPPEMAESPAPMPEPAHDGRLMQFSRRHPVLTVAGLAGVGLVGGLEMAAGILLGAGVFALIRRPDAAAPPHAEEPGRMRKMFDRAPHDLQALRERARAVVLAARGEIHAPAEHGNPAS